jgi:endonuclease I
MKIQLLAMTLLLGCATTTDETDVLDTDLPGCEEIDGDADGSNSCDDCDDADAAVYPGALERCNGLDDDCDGVLAWSEDDVDGDGNPDCQTCDSLGFWTFIISAETGGLQESLHLATDDHECRHYSEATDYMFVNLDKVDGEVECVYTGRKVAVSNDKPDGNDMNTEHTWPQSFGAETIPARCDLNHLFPTDALANTKRGSHPFGEVSGGVDWSSGGSTLGDNADGVTVFEPRDIHKGNVARAMLYFEIRYGGNLSEEEHSGMMGDERRAMFLGWHQGDLPTDVDVARTEVISAYMGAGNPLVACDGLTELLVAEQLGETGSAE